MNEITVASRPETLGLSADRLARIHHWMARYVDAGQLPWVSAVVARHGEIAWQGQTGLADIAAGRAIADDAIVRIYSMSKPITAVAALMLYEEGRFQLDDPIGRYIPELADMRVRIAEHGDDLVTEASDGPITINHLFTHRSGFIYGAFGDDGLARLYSARKMHFGGSSGTLADQTALLGQLPLHHHPGRHWSYGVSTDVLGRLVEVLSGQSFDRYLAERVFAPLGMTDSFFELPSDRQGRFLPCYRKTDSQLLELWDSGEPGTRFTSDITCFSGGGGLLSTQRDYLRFAEMLRRGGELDGNRLLSPRTVAFMASNHLEGDIAAIDRSSFGESATVGVGFGLGVSVMLDPAATQMLASPGEFGWGGMASTAFWVDPALDLCVVFMSQLIPSSTYPLRRELHALVQQAILD